MLTTENNHSQYQYRVDALGLRCPLPLLKMKQALNKAEVGEIVFVEVSDAASERDFQAFIELTPHSLIMKKEDDKLLYWITKSV